MFTLAHMSDVHLAPIDRPRWRDLASKRILGYLNWRRGRKDIHLAETLARLVADMEAQHPDHIAVTGDLVNLGLPAEYEKARLWLQSLGHAERVSVVPGNHDAYVRMRRDPGIRRWTAHMTSNAPGAAVLAASGTAPVPAGSGHGGAPVAFPYLRRFGSILLVGLSSAVPTAPFLASGRLGRAQREALADCLAKAREMGLFRIVLIHHPPLPGQARWRRGLTDAAAFAEVLAREGAELVLHGHNHRQSLRWAEGPRDPAAGGSGERRRVPVVGVPSASVGHPGHGPLARYNLFRIVPVGEGRGGTHWRIEMTGRGLDPAAGHAQGPVRLLEHRLIATVTLAPPEARAAGAGHRPDRLRAPVT